MIQLDRTNWEAQYKYTGDLYKQTLIIKALQEAELKVIEEQLALLPEVKTEEKKE